MRNPAARSRLEQRVKRPSQSRTSRVLAVYIASLSFGSRADCRHLPKRPSSLAGTAPNSIALYRACGASWDASGTQAEADVSESHTRKTSAVSSDLLTTLSELDGYDQLLAMRAHGIRAPMLQTLKLELTKLDRGQVVFEGSPDRSVYNPIGTVHGGYAATLLDSACGIAVHSKLRIGQTYT